MTDTALADAILVFHAAFVLFIVGGLAATWIGVALGKAFARNFAFRALHFAAMGFVVVETVFGYMCPLTTWEDALRGTAGGRGFIERWIHAWLFWDLPPVVFATAYIAFAALIAWTWWRFPPRRRT